MRHGLITSSIATAAVVLISMMTSIARGADAPPTKVLVAPFTEVNEQQQPDWINRAIQQSVSDELSALASVEVVPNNPSVPLPSTAQAKGAGVEYIVRATIQRLNGEIRITGRVQKVDDGKTVGGFKATGSQGQLFAIEDSIAQQLKRVIAPMEADLEDARPVGTAPARGGTTPLQPPQSPTRGVFEGSDLQRSLEDRDYLRRVQRRAPTDYTQPPVYYPPTPVVYPPTYPGYGGYGYGYGYGYGDGWGGDTNVVIINPGGGSGGGGSGGGGGGGGGGMTPPPSRPHVPIQTVQTQRLRDAAVYPGQSGNFIGPTPARPPGIPTKHPGTAR